MEIALISTYPPRPCGIATFSAHLRQGLLAAGPVTVPVIPITPGDGLQPAGPEVLMQLRQHRREDYLRAAGALNESSADVVIIQHEYGIFGGPDGSHLIDLVKALQKPVIITLHTVMSNPSPSQRGVLRELLAGNAHAVVLAERARMLLQTVYGISGTSLSHIPHGVPEVSAEAAVATADLWSAHFAFGGRVVALTFGLLGPGKGIELALDAVAQAAPTHPELLYVVAGATHPGEISAHGEAYRESLQARVKSLGITNHVRFVNQYLSESELFGLIAASDIYITPYPGKEQISSGTLTYAAYMGKAILSTPYAYAQELLADGAGRLFPFGDPMALAAGLGDLARDATQRTRLGARVTQRTFGFAWKSVGQRYQDLVPSLARSESLVVRS